MPDGARTIAPASLDEATTKNIQARALEVFDLLQCEGLARVDFFLEKSSGEILLNEVNTLPGFTPISMYPKMWQTSGISYSELISRLVELAFERLGREWQLAL